MCYSIFNLKLESGLAIFTWYFENNKTLKFFSVDLLFKIHREEKNINM